VSTGCIVDVRDADLIEDNGDGESVVARGSEEVEGGSEFKSGAMAASGSLAKMVR
jgi:hypothetical protein